MNKEKLISLIIKKQTYKQTKPILTQITNQNKQSIKTSISAIKDILTKQYNTQAKLYALRFLKDCFEMGSIIFIKYTQQHLLSLLVNIIIDSTDQSSIMKYAGSSYTKTSQLTKFKSIVISFFMLAKQSVMKWAQWIPNQNYKFEKQYYQLKKKGVNFQQQVKYFRQENQMNFFTNCKKNGIKLDDKKGNKQQNNNNNNTSNSNKLNPKSQQNPPKPQSINKPQQHPSLSQQFKLSSRMKPRSKNKHILQCHKILQSYDNKLLSSTFNDKDLQQMNNKINDLLSDYMGDQNLNEQEMEIQLEIVFNNIKNITNDYQKYKDINKNKSKSNNVDMKTNSVINKQTNKQPIKQINKQTEKPINQKNNVMRKTQNNIKNQKNTQTNVKNQKNTQTNVKNQKNTQNNIKNQKNTQNNIKNQQKEINIKRFNDDINQAQTSINKNINKTQKLLNQKNSTIRNQQSLQSSKLNDSQLSKIKSNNNKTSQQSQSNLTSKLTSKLTQNNQKQSLLVDSQNFKKVEKKQNKVIKEQKNSKLLQEANKVQSNLNKMQSNMNKIQSNINKVQSNINKVQLNMNKVQQNINKVILIKPKLLTNKQQSQRYESNRFIQKFDSRLQISNAESSRVNFTNDSSSQDQDQSLQVYNKIPLNNNNNNNINNNNNKQKLLKLQQIPQQQQQIINQSSRRKYNHNISNIKSPHKSPHQSPQQSPKYFPQQSPHQSNTHNDCLISNQQNLLNIYQNKIKELQQKLNKKNQSDKLMQLRIKQLDLLKKIQQDELNKLKQQNHKIIKQFSSCVNSEQYQKVKKQFNQVKYKNKIIQNRMEQLNKEIFKLKQQKDNTNKLNQSYVIMIQKQKQKQKMLLKQSKNNQKLLFSQKRAINNNNNQNKIQNNQKSLSHFNNQTPISSFIKHQQAFYHLQQLDNDYKQNKTSLSCINNYLNQNNINLLKRSILGYKQLCYTSQQLSIVSRCNYYKNQSMTIKLDLAFHINSNYQKKNMPLVKICNLQEIDIWKNKLVGEQSLYHQQIILKLKRFPFKLIKMTVQLNQYKKISILLPVIYYNFLHPVKVIQQQFDQIFENRKQNIIKSKVFTLNSKIIKQFYSIIQYQQNYKISKQGNKIRFKLYQKSQSNNLFWCQIINLSKQKCFIKVICQPFNQQMYSKSEQLIDNLIFVLSITTG